MNTSVISPEDITVMFSAPIPLTGGDKLVGVWLPARLVADLHVYLDKVQCDMVEDVEFTNVISSFSSSRHLYLLQKDDGKVVKVKPNRPGSSRFKLCDVQCVRKEDDTGEHVALLLWFKDFDRMTRFNTPPVIRSYFNEEELALMNERTAKEEKQLANNEEINNKARCSHVNREQMLRKWAIRLADTLTSSGVPMGDFNLSILEEELRAFLMANEPDWRNVARRHLKKLVWWIENKHGDLPASHLTYEEHSEMYNILLDIPQLQETTCACCLEVRQTPIRNDDMGGYVCLACVDKELERLQAEGRRHDWK